MNEAKLAIARNYYYKRDYDKVSVIINEITNSNSTPRIKLDAKMIMLSIERNNIRKRGDK